MFRHYLSILAKKPYLVAAISIIALVAGSLAVAANGYLVSSAALPRIPGVQTAKSAESKPIPMSSIPNTIGYHGASWNQASITDMSLPSFAGGSSRGFNLLPEEIAYSQPAAKTQLETPLNSRVALDWHGSQSAFNFGSWQSTGTTAKKLPDTTPPTPTPIPPSCILFLSGLLPLWFFRNNR